ncbi:metal-dependent transcriptional regulator [Myxococcota bacterium]|jgi:DtxR family Mn-dependent transcriptional regulator|nr:metal-dependent transcriptional regulator [Myxococcota bacterium]MBU1411140.1 metal-dependent transcriptional regulator [Myxococcota bacterium]MBU1509009.1 metal-dependent transcriptional regulator [Myxococcota bacterium]PKN27483.1 MAG: hypothetical protein CVU65_02350 [Deltaproteobacteria bacterium HGW-Deltaproteobacteria-22]
MICGNRKKSIETNGLTQALEDYLLTIYQFAQSHGFVRVKDIVRARNVKAGSVSPAMRRLSELGLVEYVQREYIKLTETGETEARKIFSRHELLSRFFHEILKMEHEGSEEEACAMEHSLSETAMDRLVSFFEFLHVCPHSFLTYWERYQTCRGSHPLDHQCERCSDADTPRAQSGCCNPQPRTLAGLTPGSPSRIIKIGGTPGMRRSLLDRGILPESQVEIDHFLSDGALVHLDGFVCKLTLPECEAIYVA